MIIFDNGIDLEKQIRLSTESNSRQLFLKTW